MRVSIFALSIVFLASNAAFGYLGGFEQVDGYIDVGDHLGDSPSRNFNVAGYNAGEYDESVRPFPNGYMTRANGAGLWERLQGPITNNNSAYATSHRQAGNVMPYSGQRALVVTTNTNGWNADSQIYSYQIDAKDLGGLNPANSDNKPISISFWVCSEIAGTGTGGGLGSNTRGNYISFWDGSGQQAISGFQISYLQPAVTDDYPSFRFDKNGAWNNQLAYKVDPHGWHRWDIILDLATNQASVDYFDPQYSPNPITFASGVPIPDMAGLKEIRFESTPGINNAKFFAIDDFGFGVVPEPAAFGLMSMGALIAAANTRRRPRC